MIKRSKERLINLIKNEDFSREYESYFEINEEYSRISCNIILNKIILNKCFREHCLKNIRYMSNVVIEYFNQNSKSLFD